MKQDFPMRRRAAGIAVAALIAAVPTAHAAPVRGAVTPVPDIEHGYAIEGYTRTQVAAPAASETKPSADFALFLNVLESLPLPKPEQTPRIEVRGLRLVPRVAACATDGQLVFVNAEPAAVTLEVAGEQVALDPDETYTYECTAGDAARRVRVKEWPHIRGLLYVGEVGVAGSVADDGAFTLVAPDGKYELLILTRNGVAAKRPVEIAGAAVNVGTIDPTSDDKAATP